VAVLSQLRPCGTVFAERAVEIPNNQGRNREWPLITRNWMAMTLFPWAANDTVVDCHCLAADSDWTV
jgi:hypothetical protein